ncbi:MAG: GTP-binding protein, partial [Alphaproteobacteria bacterium]|nr:GTP-binding protein [Alphaproteobacteria bacterium]
MRLKSFTATTMAEAMHLARQDLGEDAVIVATAEDAAEGAFRVSVAVETPDAPSPRARSNGGAEPEPIAAALAYHGVPEDLAAELLAVAGTVDEKDPILRLAAGFDSRFQFLPLSERAPDRPIMLIGPPGAGKTSGVAKLITRAVLKKQAVTVVTTDIKRAGGIEQLEAFTQIMGIDLHIAQDPGALEDLMDLEGKHALTYIDSAGTNPFDEQELAVLRSFIEASGAEPVLVLSAGGDPREMREIGEAFGTVGASRLLISRLDMARRLGGALAAADHINLKFSNVSVAP